MPDSRRGTVAGDLRRGWTTGACATAAARAAFEALVTGAPPPDPVEIALPSGKRVAFALAEFSRGEGSARAAIVKDAGDDPDVTHGALIRATVRRAAAGAGVSFKAGEGVGTVTRPGLPLPPGEPAINPVPRAMMRQTIEEAARALGVGADAEIEVSIPGGEEMAKHTLNGRLGIVGGLSILGTTGIVTPFSCAAWIDSIHRGVDVARASGLAHIAGSTGSTSEAAVQKLHQLPEPALIEMGDFAGGFLKYVRTHPVARVTIAGGFAKMTKLAQGRLDLHSGRSSIDLARLAATALAAGASDDVAARIESANSALEALQIAQVARVDLAGAIARDAYVTVAQTLDKAPVAAEVIVFDRQGGMLARAGAPPPCGEGLGRGSRDPSQDLSTPLPGPPPQGGRGRARLPGVPMTENPHLTFVLGGARSGKSAYAERLIEAHPSPWIYIATAQAFDDEMRARIDLHRSRRGGNWRTVEAPQELAQAILTAPADAPLLIDCLAIWLSNRMFVEADLVADRAALIAALSSRAAPTVVVSPEVGLSIVPENALARAFRDAAGLMHQEVAKMSAHVALVVAGYPVKVK